VLRTWLLLLLACEPLLCQPWNLDTVVFFVTSESAFTCVLVESSVAGDSKHLSEQPLLSERSVTARPSLLMVEATYREVMTSQATSWLTKSLGSAAKTSQFKLGGAAQPTASRGPAT
jgi:hypothetical protein